MKRYDFLNNPPSKKVVTHVPIFRLVIELAVHSLKEVTIRDIFGGGEGHEFLKKA